MKIIKKKIENLRQKAVQLVETQPNHSTSLNTIEAELLKTVDLLVVHQIELEAQNDELQQAKLAVQDAIDLYDFAPIGYFTLSNLGEIVNLNLCGAEMLCKERSLAKNSLFANVVSDDTKHIFYNFLDRVFSSTVQETCNVTIISNCNMPMFVHLTGIFAQNDKHCYVTTLDISELRRVEGNLFESEEKFQAIIQSQSEGIGVVNANEIFEFANIAANKIFEIDNLIGQSLYDFLPLTEKDSIVKQTENRQLGNTGSYELQIVTKKGKRKHIFVSTTPKFDLHNNYQGAYGIFIDITERKLAEKKLQESEALYHSILLASPDSITITDLEGNILFISPKTLSMFGYESTEDLLNNNLNNFIVPEDREKVHLEIIRMHQGIFTGSAEYKAIRSDKGIFDIDVNAEFIRDANGVPTKMVFIVRDITERKKAEILRDQQLFYTKALNEIAEIIISYDSAEEILENVNCVLGKTLQVDRTLIYNVMFDKQEIEGLCEWLRFDHPDIATTKGIYPLEMFRNPFLEIWNSKKLIESQSDAVNVHFIEDGSGVVLHQQMNIKSLLWYPFRFQDNGCHVFTLNQILEPRQWTDEDINFLESVGKQVNLALEKISFLEERKIAEQELRKFRTISDQANYGAFICSLERKFVYVNETYANMLGWDVKELIGKKFITVLYNTEHYSESEEIRQIIERDGGFSAKEFHNTRKDGTVIPTLMSAKLIFDENNAIQFLSGTCIDITERKQVEEELKKLSQAVEQSPVSIVITNIDGEIEYSNPKSCETTGYSLEELIGKNPRLLQSGETPKDDYSALWNTIGTGKEWHGTFHNKKKNGELYWESSTIAPVLDSNGKITNYVAIKEDITEKKKADEEIVKFKTIADKANYGTAITTTEGDFIYVNDAFAQMHGLDAK
ncbi:MAG: PAS domain S-box protein, partial [Paludibacter sp.]